MELLGQIEYAVKQTLIITMIIDFVWEFKIIKE